MISVHSLNTDKRPGCRILRRLKFKDIIESVCIHLQICRRQSTVRGILHYSKVVCLIYCVIFTLIFPHCKVFCSATIGNKGREVLFWYWAPPTPSSVLLTAHLISKTFVLLLLLQPMHKQTSQESHGIKMSLKYILTVKSHIEMPVFTGL